MGTLTEVLWLLLWGLVILIPEFESASVSPRAMDPGEREHEQTPLNVPDVFLSNLENKRPFSVFPFWNKQASPSSTDPPSLNNDINVSNETQPSDSSIDDELNFHPRRIHPRRVHSSRNGSNLLKRARRRRKQMIRPAPLPSRILRRTTTAAPPLQEKDVTPTMLTQLHTVSEMLVTRNVTSTRTVTVAPPPAIGHFTHNAFNIQGVEFTTPVPAQRQSPSTVFMAPHTTVSPFELQERREGRVGEVRGTEVVNSTYFPDLTTDFPEVIISTTTIPEGSEVENEEIVGETVEELRSPKRIRDSPPPAIELLNPFEDQGKEEEMEDEEPPSSTSALYLGEEPHAGQYHEINPGQYHEVNPGQYHEENPGQYYEINPGQYVHHSETEEGNPTTIQIHHRDEDKKVYNVQSKVDEFIIGEYGTISKSSGQTLQGVRYTAIGESVDSKLIYDTLIKFFNFQ
eukprot:TRINITY_DN3688_c0_g1_i1.p1 TRINITY_DN3688_c0_g1~~TRINITY_DN3688_c0_g1_i1.p1  ORF type:complete len:457 (-),score=99.76 TRINITY_DN3688_c0_g1_i1:480-1850(-)